MEMSSKLKFILITTCALMHSLASSNALYVRDVDEISAGLIDDVIHETADRQPNTPMPSMPEITTLQPESETHKDIVTDMVSEMSTTMTSVLLNKIIETVQNVTTIREGKSITTDATAANTPENNSETIKPQLNMVDKVVVEPATELSTPTTNPPLVEMHEKKEEEMDVSSNNAEDNLIVLNEAMPQSVEHVVSTADDHVEIQKLTTGEDLEASIKKAVRDEIRSDSGLEVLETIPDADLQESVIKEILGDAYEGRSQTNSNKEQDDVGVKYETIVTDAVKETEQEETPNAIEEEVKEKIEDKTEAAVETVTKESTDAPKPIEVQATSSTDMTTEASVETHKSSPTEIPEKVASPDEKVEKLPDTVEHDEGGVAQTARGGRSMGRSNSIRNDIEVENSLEIEPAAQEEPVEVTTVRSNLKEEALNLEKHRDSEDANVAQHVEEGSGHQQKIENEVEARSGATITAEEEGSGAEELSEAHVAATEHSPTEKSEISSPMTTLATPTENVASVEPQEGQSKHLSSEVEAEIIDHVIVGTISPPTDVEKEKLSAAPTTQASKEVKGMEEATTLASETHENTEQVTTAPEVMDKVDLVPEASPDAETATTITPETSKTDSDEVEVTTVTPVATDLPEKHKEDKGSVSSDSSESSEEVEKKTKKAEKEVKSEKPESSESSEESSEESADKKEENKVQAKGRSLSIVTNLQSDTAAENPTSASEAADDGETEHMIKKKPSAQSEDENSLSALPAIAKTPKNSEVPIPLNPRLKVLLPTDETERIPMLTFETTTLLPLKVFKFHSTDPLVADETQNKNEIAPRLLESTEESNAEQKIRQLVDTESTTRLIAETVTEAVELGKEINRNMNLFLDPFETNRTLHAGNAANHPAADNEIMAASSIAEALPNQDIKYATNSMNPTMVVLICVSIIIMIVAVIVVTFFRFRTPQGVLDIEMQEQRHGKDCDDEHDHRSDYQCCTATRSSSSSGADDTLSHSASCSLATTTSTSSASASSTSKSTLTSVKRSVSDCRSNLSMHSVDLSHSDEKQKLHTPQPDDDDEQETKLIPTETCKLISKNCEQSKHNAAGADDDDESL